MLVTLVNPDRKPHDNAWRVIDKRQTVMFSNRPGPWLLVVPQGAGFESDQARWVHLFFDRKYKVMPFG